MSATHQSPPIHAPAADEDLERQIDYQALLLHSGKTRGERQSAWSELRRLHALRSPGRVAEMELERGLR